jgi:putative glycosyltransferase (TIGR04348 family)
MPSNVAPTILLETPYLADANNGNWRTAARWSRLLSKAYRPIVQAADAPLGGRGADSATAMIALHARRSRAAIEAWRASGRALIVALTGTDLYRDLPCGDAAALASIADADRLIVLQSDALEHLPTAPRFKADVVHQSARALRPFTNKPAGRLRCVLVAHLREEKDPRTVFEAWKRLPANVDATLAIVGAALDPALGDAATALAAADPRVRALGPRPHPWTRQAIRRAHVIIVASRMEGGANVVVEAVTSGTAVLASRISGNIGMLGEDYAGYFEAGDADALAALVARAHRNRAFLERLGRQCARRAPMFSPAAEQAALIASVERARRAAAGRM